MICISQKSSTANLFVIFDLYDKLAAIFDANPDLNRDNIWNCNELRFPIAPSKSKIMATFNKPGFKLSYGSYREHVTTLAVFNATRNVLDPLIIFKDKHFQPSWYGNIALPNTFYGVTVND